MECVNTPGMFGSGKPILDRPIPCLIDVEVRINKDGRCQSLSNLINTSEWPMRNGEE